MKSSDTSTTSLVCSVSWVCKLRMVSILFNGLKKKKEEHTVALENYIIQIKEVLLEHSLAHVICVLSVTMNSIREK